MKDFKAFGKNVYEVGEMREGVSFIILRMQNGEWMRDGVYKFHSQFNQERCLATTLDGKMLTTRSATLCILADEPEIQFGPTPGERLIEL